MHARESIFLNFHEIRAILRQLTSGRRHISLCYVDICLLRVVVSYSPKRFTLSKFNSKVPLMLANGIQKYYSSSNKKILQIFIFTISLKVFFFKISIGFFFNLIKSFCVEEKILRYCAKNFAFYLSIFEKIAFC